MIGEMKIKSAELETVCGVSSNLPGTDLPEIAFCGRSNVGKSSLINTLLNRKALARTSSSPGKTQTINYYNINKQLYFVDLPGYGYAKVSKKEREAWGNMIENYLTKSMNLKSIFILVDIRHDPPENDRQMVEWVRYQGREPVIIATKKDKIKKSQLQKNLNAIKKGLDLKDGGRIFPFSSVTKEGRDDIMGYISSLIDEG